MPPSARIYPRGATVLEDQLYLAGSNDSIFIFDFKTYNTPIVPATDESVEVVPEVLGITFDSILDSGWVYVDVTDSQECAPPAGVTFISDFYDISLTSRVEYISEVTVSDSFPPGLDFDRMRIFTRPSDSCGVFRDITVEAAVLPPSLRIYARQRSEDDEFSYFAPAIDSRAPGDIVDLKFSYLQGHIESGQDSIPQAAYARITDLLTRAQNHWSLSHPLTAAMLVDSIAVVARNATAIPHIYNPMNPGRNLAGRIISRAHTLSFSLRYYRAWLAGVERAPAPGPFHLIVRPNPSGSCVQIELVRHRTGHVDVSVYSVGGELVKRLYRGVTQEENLSLEWTGVNRAGDRVSPGIYFVFAREGSKTAARKVILH
jgi:hypothetical protein